LKWLRESKTNLLTIRISGLKGGHSGEVFEGVSIINDEDSCILYVYVRKLVP